jgi:hypothetical protein
MSEAIQTIPAPIEAYETSGAATNPAIASCMRAWRHAYQKERVKGTSEYSATIYAGLAYRRAMPPLSGQDNIRDFIACVAYGLLIDAINDKTGPKLLYAARIAHTTAHVQSAHQKTVAA